MKIVADVKIPFLKGALERYAEVIYLPGKQISNESLKDADALLIRTRTKCNEELLKGTGVRFIGTATIGFDHINTGYCGKHNIHWTNAPGCNSSSVQQYIASALLKASSEFRFSLKDKTIGIIGVGNVGSKVEKFARVMGMNVLLNDPPRARREGDESFVKLDTLLKNSDIVTIHVPLSIEGEDKTYHLFNEQNFDKMKKGAWLFNSSRGEVADTHSLKRSLLISQLENAVLDVWENEPDIDIELMSEAFIATPHIAGYSTDGKANGTAMVINALSKFFNLPMNNWYPDDVPGAPFPEIIIEGNSKSDEDIIREAVRHTYNIEEDHLKLRSAPSDFEKQRGDYYLRREFPSYTVKIKNGTVRVHAMLEELGFKVKV